MSRIYVASVGYVSLSANLLTNVNLKSFVFSARLPLVLAVSGAPFSSFDGLASVGFPRLRRWDWRNLRCRTPFVSKNGSGLIGVTCGSFLRFWLSTKMSECRLCEARGLFRLLAEDLQLGRGQHIGRLSPIRRASR